MDHVGAGARVGGAGVRGAGVEGAQAPKPPSHAAASDDVKGSPAAHALAKSSGTNGMPFHCETLCLLHCVQHFEHASCTCGQQLCAVSSCTSCMRFGSISTIACVNVLCSAYPASWRCTGPSLNACIILCHLTWSVIHQDTSVLMLE